MLLKLRLVCAALAAVVLVSTACDQVPTGPTLPFTKIDLRTGTGLEVINGSLVLVNFTGWLYSESGPDHKGLQFFTTAQGGPLVFAVGASGIIPGLDLGMPGMRVGGLRRLIIPASLAYGNTGAGAIPPNTTVIYEIELLDVG